MATIVQTRRRGLTGPMPRAGEGSAAGEVGGAVADGTDRLECRAQPHSAARPP